MNFLNNVTAFLMWVNHTLTPIGCVLTAVFLLIVLVLMRIMLPSKKPAKFAGENYQAISGDDIVTTQLNLARALLEMDRKKEATDILKNIVNQGSAQQRESARQLLRNI